LVLTALVAVGCGTNNADPDSAPPTTRATSDAAASETATDVIDGTFDVGGHSLYLTCEGTGSPTVVYMHGSIVESGVDPHANGDFLFDLADQNQVCLYDRRNLAHSDVVDAPQLPSDALEDMHDLLAAAEVAPPYVLVGASFGGLLSYLYANTYPDEVAGMVLLDSMFPDEMKLESLFPKSDRYRAFSDEDEDGSLERISHFKVMQAAQPYVGHEPDIPVTYLSSIPEGYDVNDYGIPAYDQQILKLQKAYAERFDPGRWVRVDAPHFMEAAIPDEIVGYVREVLAAAGS
jgi:pimeloyl-ACP methyl ester carboxylesterase